MRRVLAPALVALWAFAAPMPARAEVQYFTIQLASPNPAGRLFVGLGVQSVRLGAPITLSADQGPAQQWRLDDPRYPFGSGRTARWKIINRHSGKCLDLRGPSSANGSPVHQWNCYSTTSQRWMLIPQTDGSGTIQIESEYQDRQKCLDVTGFRDRVGTNLQIYSCSVGWNQRFRINNL